MPRRPVALPLTLPPRDCGTAAYRWLYAAIRQEIASGQLGPGFRLPATRDLAVQYGLSRGTVVAAFELLRAEGYVEGAVGSGTRVSGALPGSRPPTHERARTRGADVPPPRRISAVAGRLVPYRQHASASTRAFRANQPALDLFPRTAWARAASRCLRRASPDLLLGTDPLGHLPLRTAIAEYLAASRGVNCAADRIAVVSGVQEALNVVAALLVDPGDAVCLEDPGYTGAARVFTATGARIVAAPIDDDGAVVPRSAGAARLAYLTPAHQFPLGVCMSLPRRLQWLDWARGTGALIVEDDYDSEFRYSGRPVSALQGLDRDGSVVFTGSFSKVLCPSLRIGYLVLPDDLVDRVSAHLSVVSRHASLLNQAVLHEFIASGEFARHLRRMRDAYGERLGALVVASRRWLRGGLDVVEVEAGLQTIGRFVTPAAAADVAHRAAAADVEVVPLSRYARAVTVPEGLQIGFAAADVAEIGRGVRALARVLDRPPGLSGAPSPLPGV